MNPILNFKPYWCHACRTQQLLNTNQIYLYCTNCNSELVEQIESFDLHPSIFIPQGLQPQFRHPVQHPYQFFSIITGTFLNSNRGAPPASRNDFNNLETVELGDIECPICQDPIQGQAKKMTCGHAYHFQCLQPWLEIHNTCPVCRVPLK